jgi:hypothetical protein
MILIFSAMCRGLFCVFNEFRWKVIVRFVDIGEIVDHHYLLFFSYYSYLLSNAKSNLIKHKKWVRIFDILNETRIMDDKERLKIPEE